MLTRPLLILACALIVLGAGGSLLYGRSAAGSDARLVSVFDPYAMAPLQAYGAFRAATAAGDVVALQALADDGNGYLAYRAALEVARWPSIDATTRLAYMRRAMRLRVDDPLARSENRALTLEWAGLAEEAGAWEEALGAYEAALPAEPAVEALERLETDPYVLANAMLNARLYGRALTALDGRSAPSIEAPANRALGNYAQALDDYRAWLGEQPSSATAMAGKAWTLYSLGELDAAAAAFRDLPGANGLYGRALIANKRGDIDTAVSMLAETGDPDWLWLATSLLEARDRYQDAIPLYLRLARGGSAYADDAAYRAYVLATRHADTDTADTALALVPDDSFFALKLGRTLSVADFRRNGDGPTAGASVDASVTAAASEPDAVPELPVVALARALHAAHDPASAIGELTMALRDAQEAPLGTPATAGTAPPYGDTPAERREVIITLAQSLQNMGEFRHSVQAARSVLRADESDVRVWRLAYPTAYSEAVRDAAAAADVPADLVWSIMRQESAFSPVAVSRSDAMGLMQVVPSTWNWLAELQGDASPADPFDPIANIRYGTYYLGWLLRYFDGDVELTISSYNRGQGYIGRLFGSDYVAGDKDELYREIDALETREYLQRVSVNLATYRALYPADDAVVRTASTEP